MKAKAVSALIWIGRLAGNDRLFKWSIISVVIVCTIYPIFELTRYILKYNSWTGAENAANNWTELLFMWVGYALMIVFLNWILGHILKGNK